MPSKRPRPFKLAMMVIAPLIIIALALVATFTTATAAPNTSAPTLKRFYIPKHSNAKGSTAAHPYSTRNNLRHGSGPVMHTSTTYAIFWEPPTLQDGSQSYVANGYNSLEDRFLGDVGGTNFYNILTQYYDVNNSGGHIQNSSTFGGAYVDTSSYPPGNSDCYNQGSNNPTNCIGDSQMQGEISHAMSVNGWSSSINNLFVLFTVSGEDTCSGIVGGCSSNVYCGFHFYYGSQNQPYAIMPYGGTGNGCDAGQPSPNGNSDADYEISTLAHELFETVSDPWPNQNWTGPLGEIGDACAYNYGSYRYDGGQANEYLHGHYYSTQQMWDNRVGGCRQTGP